jgi:hypothetical protein
MYDRTPEVMYYSMLKKWPAGPEKVNWGRIEQELDDRFSAGVANATCRWKSLVDPAYRNWYSLDTLLKLWKKDEALTYFTNRLAAIMGIIASVVQGR